jgi:hypothetical protein
VTGSSDDHHQHHDDDERELVSRADAEQLILHGPPAPSWDGSSHRSTQGGSRSKLRVRRGSQDHWVLGCVEVHQTTNAIGIASAERMENVATTGVPDHDRLHHFQAATTSRMSSALR